MGGVSVRPRPRVSRYEMGGNLRTFQLRGTMNIAPVGLGCQLNEAFLTIDFVPDSSGT